jgi:hypothetical protein
MTPVRRPPPVSNHLNIILRDAMTTRFDTNAIADAPTARAAEVANGAARRTESRILEQARKAIEASLLSRQLALYWGRVWIDSRSIGSPTAGRPQ